MTKSKSSKSKSSKKLISVLTLGGIIATVTAVLVILYVMGVFDKKGGITSIDRLFTKKSGAIPETMLTINYPMNTNKIIGGIGSDNIPYIKLKDITYTETDMIIKYNKGETPSNMSIDKNFSFAKTNNGQLDIIKKEHYIDHGMVVLYVQQGEVIGPMLAISDEYIK